MPELGARPRVDRRASSKFARRAPVDRNCLKRSCRMFVFLGLCCSARGDGYMRSGLHGRRSTTELACACARRDGPRVVVQMVRDVRGPCPRRRRRMGREFVTSCKSRRAPVRLQVLLGVPALLPSRRYRQRPCAPRGDGRSGGRMRQSRRTSRTARWMDTPDLPRAEPSLTYKSILIFIAWSRNTITRRLSAPSRPTRRRCSSLAPWRDHTGPSGRPFDSAGPVSQHLRVL